MELWHTGILTADIEKTIAFFAASGGAPRDKWTVFDAEFSRPDLVIGTEGRIRAAIGYVGGVTVELLQPLDDTSYHAQALRTRGAGLHHNAYVCEDNLDESVAALIAEGGRIVWELQQENTHGLYIEAADGGTIVEIINHRPFMPEE